MCIRNKNKKKGTRGTKSNAVYERTSTPTETKKKGNRKCIKLIFNEFCIKAIFH